MCKFAGIIPVYAKKVLAILTTKKGERNVRKTDICIRDERLSFVFDRWGEGPKEPSEGYEPIIVIDCQESEDGVGDPMIIMYTYNGEIRVTSLICDSHADTYIYKII